MIVSKFGGTSVEDTAAIRRLIAIVQDRVAERPVVVVSAFAGVTDQLLIAGTAAASGRLEHALKLTREFEGRTRQIASDLVDVGRREFCSTGIRNTFSTLRELLRGIAAVGELSPRSSDAVVSYGEIVSSFVVSLALQSAGVSAAWVDTRECVITNEQHTHAIPDVDQTRLRCLGKLQPFLDEDTAPVLGGFIAATRSGITTTLGRGGSDLTASLLAACLDATRIEIWTDVDGILTADPRLCPAATLIGEISFAEASELAHFGAKVLHPSTLIPAQEKDIPVQVLNARNPSCRGTLITNGKLPRGVRAIATKGGVAVLNVEVPRTLQNASVLQRTLAALDNSKCNVELVGSSDHSVSAAVSEDSGLSQTVAVLSSFSRVEVERGQTIVCLAGQEVGWDGTWVTVFDALPGIDIRMISHAVSRNSISLVVNNSDAQTVVQALHRAIFGNQIAVQPRPLQSTTVSQQAAD